MSFLDSLFGSKKTNVPSIPVLPADIYAAATMELADVIAPPAVEIGSNTIKIGDKIAKTYFAMSYPRILSAGWLAPIVNMDKVFDISIHINPIDTSEILRDFQKKVAEVESQILSRQSQGMVRDPQLDAAYQNLESLRDNLQQATEKMFDVGLYITIYATHENDLFKLENQIRSELEGKQIYLKPALFQQEQGFRTVIPTGTDELRIMSKLNSGPLSSFFPFISSELTDNKGILYGVNRQNAGLVIFDRFSMPNYNSVIFARSGAGKSYATKLEIVRTMMFDTDVLVIDPENEYQYLAEAVGGRFFKVSLSSNSHINPFDLPKPLPDESPSDVLRANITSLIGLFRIILGGLKPEEDSIIDRAITETYALKDITAEADFTALPPPLLSDFEQVLGSMEGSESLVERLKKYTKGTWAGFMNQPTNVDIDQKLVVFSIRDMEDELKPAAMYIITHFIWNAVRKSLKKRLLVVDEAWVMMQNEEAAAFLFGMAKRGRKYFLGLATITQDVGDFVKSRYGVPIITNSSLQLLLGQSPTAIDTLQTVFNLTDGEKYALLESGVGEGIFFAGKQHVSLKIISSYTEDQIVSSDPHQILALRKAKEEQAASTAGGLFVN
ncbi:MAG: type secretory pathway VirB4 component-like protein [Patescibacteria group bacterium]|nr:type secretory pathway VirB4 component-like protein [Patescibacteria group bacterium]